MDAWKLGIAFFGGIAVTQSLFLGLLQLLKMRQKQGTFLWLGILLIGLTLRIGKSLFYYLLPSIATWGVALGGAGLFLIGPSLYFFLKNSQEEDLPKQKTFWHFIPGFLIAFSWVLIQGYYLVYLIGTVHLAIYFILSLSYFVKQNWNGKRKSIQVLLASVGIIVIVFASQLLASNIQWYTIGSAMACAVLYTLNFYILNDRDFFRIPKKTSKVKNKEQYPQLALEINQIFSSQKIYRQKGLTVSGVAAQLNRPVYLISQVIKNDYQTKFNEFVNRFRVEEVKTRLKDQECNLTIEAIAQEAGFSSTSSLYQAFKKGTGMTPQAYRKQHIQGSSATSSFQ